MAAVGADAGLRVVNPEQIPARRYYDAAFYAEECERLWPHVWQMACRLEEIPEVGDWVEYENLDQSVIVVRTRLGVQAFHNACRHRGVQVAKGRGNCAGAGFVCPFHGWRYDMEGRNTFVFGQQLFSEAALEPSELGLRPCRVELWGGCAFINLDDQAPALLDCLGPIVERLGARNVDKLRTEWWASVIVPANWKTALEAFMEGYHVMRTHPQLHEVLTADVRRYGGDVSASAAARTPSPREYVESAVALMQRVSRGMDGQITPAEVAIAERVRDELELPDDTFAAAKAFFSRFREEITAEGRARGAPVFDLNAVAAAHKFHTVEYVFPHFFLLPTYSAMASYRVRPLGPESCLFEVWSLALIPEHEQRPPPAAPVPVAPDDPGLPEISLQDFANLTLQQRGLHAKGFDYMRLSRSVEGMISNYHRLIDGYLQGVEPARLAAASQVVNSGFDSPILDIGI
jgi:phenylpropionate dioxygenase-like ring-hydroxylating dioxygenase large terminal subunit